MIPDEAVEAAARASWELDHDGIAPRYDECSEGTKRQLHREARVVLEAAAPHLMAAAQRETVIEWGAAFKRTGNIYNYHRTREEAQAFVDSMAEVDAEMVVMTREVLTQSASEWRVHDA